MARRIDRTARADRVVEAALQLFLERPRDEVTFELLAERAGLKFWQVYNFHGNIRTLFRAAVARLAQELESELKRAPAEAASVSEAVRLFTAFAAETMARDAYVHLLYLLIRDGCVEPMLHDVYEKRIAKTLRDGLARIVGNAGLEHGLIILLSDASTRAFVKGLEVEFALPKLLPGFVPPAPEAAHAVVQRIAHQVIAASYAVGSEAA